MINEFLEMFQSLIFLLRQMRSSQQIITIPEMNDEKPVLRLLFLVLCHLQLRKLSPDKGICSFVFKLILRRQFFECTYKTRKIFLRYYSAVTCKFFNCT